MGRPSYGARAAPARYDALLYLSFGGPEGPEDVMPFLERVTAGRNVPRARLEEVAEHYMLFGGVSPINAVNRAVIAALREAIAARGWDLPVYWGNRNSPPFVADAFSAMKRDGIRRAIAFVTSAYSSYSACRQYREDIAAGRAAAGPKAPECDKLRVFFNHPGFIEPQARKLTVALQAVPEDRRARARVVFTAHSVPLAQAETSSYVAQLQEASRLVANLAEVERFDLVYQSRSGPPEVPWLEPDVCDHLEAVAASGASDVVVVPVGFVCDHLEVLFDLDVEAARRAAELGLNFVRAGTVGADPAYVEMICELVAERMVPGAPRRSLGSLGPSHDICGAQCCPAPVRRPAAAELAS